MPPNSESMLNKLKSKDAAERLEAARYFSVHAERMHEPEIRAAIARERIVWISNALRRALAKTSPELGSSAPGPSVNSDDLPKAFATQVYAEALEATTSQLMHEIEPLLGGLRLAASMEIENFPASDTFRWLDRLNQFLDAISRLRRAASSPKNEEFSLDELVQGCINEAVVPERIAIQKAGPQPCIVHGDIGLVSLAFSNGLRNAIEATVEVGEDADRVAIAVNWGTTDDSCWISIVDSGIGIKGNIAQAFEVGSTTKSGHLGMGLATAAQAMTSLSGSVSLVPNSRGVRFEIRWPTKHD